MDNTSLAPACGDARLLVTYLMREGVTVTPETLAAIENAQVADATGPLTADAKTKFLLAYSEVAKLASPVSAQSLRACSDDFPTLWKRWLWSKPREVSQADKAVLRHHTWAAVALAALLVVQIYWLIGATLVLGIKRQDQHPATEQAAATAQTSPAPVEPKAPTQTAEEEAREDTHVWLLSAWSGPWIWIPYAYQRCFPNKDVTSNHFWELYIGTKFVLQILQTYLLPLLYGWVGAMAFVLRSLIVTVKNKSFRVEQNVEYRLRVYLGVLAGLVIGWFLSSKGTAGQAGIADLTPAAISFVAGYSVEILFSTMDRIVSGFVAAFGGSTIETPQKSRN
jgi:hypothetical protein